MAATETNSHMTWDMAEFGASRVTKVMPMPESTNTMGRIAGSAPGAKKRTATWAAAKAAKRPRGTETVSSDRAVPVSMTYMA